MTNFIQKVRENWNQIDESANIEPLSIGATNTVFRIQSSQTFYLRKYRTRNIEQITREHKLLERIANNLSVIVPPVLTRNGDTFSQFDGDTYALFPEAQGKLVEKSELSELHAYQLGKTLANLHIELASISGNDFPTIELSWDKHAWIDRLREIATAIEANSKLDANGLMLKRVKQQSCYLESSKAIHSYTPLTSRQLIHGDFHHFNVFFDSKGAVSDIIDWDLVQNMPPSYEIARACMYMFNMEPDRSSTFLKGYLSVNQLSRYELSDGAMAWAVYADHHVWALEEVFLKNNIAALAFIPQSDFIPFMKQWSRIESALFSLDT